jgi:hypothetical protein
MITLLLVLCLKRSDSVYIRKFTFAHIYKRVVSFIFISFLNTDILILGSGFRPEPFKTVSLSQQMRHFTKQYIVNP